MSICKVCGAANASDATVCSSCGTSLSKKEKETHSNEIYSSKDNDSLTGKSTVSNEIYSTHSRYSEAQQKKIFEKIRRQEEVLGDTQVVAEPTVKEAVQPIVVNKLKDEGNYNQKPSSSNNYKIPQRIIESVDKQMIRQKMKPNVKSSADSIPDDEKVELTSSKVIEEIHEKHEHTMQMRKLKAEQKRQNKTGDSASEKQLQRKKDKALEKEQSQKLRQLEKQRLLEEKQAIKSDRKEEKLAKKVKKTDSEKKPEMPEERYPDIPKSRHIPSSAEIQAKTNIRQNTAPSKTPSGSKARSAAAKSKTLESNAVNNQNKTAVPCDSPVKAAPAEKTQQVKKAVKKQTNTVKVANASGTSVTNAQQVNKTVKKQSDVASTTKTSVVAGTGTQQLKRTAKGQSDVVRAAKTSVAAVTDVQKATKQSGITQTAKTSDTSAQQVKQPVKRQLNPTRNVNPENSGKQVVKKVKKTQVSDTAKTIKKSGAEAAPGVKEKHVRSTVDGKPQKNRESKSQRVKSRKVRIKKEKAPINYNFTDEDIAANKYVAALSYIGILFLFPFAKRKKSDFCRAHSRQGAILFVLSLILLIITLALVIGLRFLLVWYLSLPYIIYSILYYLIIIGVAVLIFIPVFKGAEGALNGAYVEVPIVEKIAGNQF